MSVAPLATMTTTAWDNYASSNSRAYQYTPTCTCLKQKALARTRPPNMSTTAAPADTGHPTACSPGSTPAGTLINSLSSAQVGTPASNLGKPLRSPCSGHVSEHQGSAGGAFALRREVTVTPTLRLRPGRTSPLGGRDGPLPAVTPTHGPRREEGWTPGHGSGNTSRACIVDVVGQYVSVSPGPTTAFVEYRSAGATSRKRREATETY